MIWNDIYKEQTARYNFSSKLVSGKVLDITYGSFMSYQGAKILLSENATEVFSYDIMDDDIQCSKRKLNAKNYIEFVPIFNIEFDDGYFDAIISTESIQYSKDPKLMIEEYYRLLKRDGVLIISTANKDGVNTLYGKSVEGWDDSIFKQKEFLQILKKTFSNIELFSQRLIPKSEIIEKRFNLIIKLIIHIRKILSTLLLKFDKKSNFYQSYLQKNIVKMNSSIEKMNKNILNVDYNPIKFEISHNPLFFIAICRK